jgi:tripartite-type tricarboxylate transporter receptor subunit TctC
MKLSFSSFPKFVLIASLLASAAPLLHAQDSYPSRPIRWMVGYPPGGGSDFLARTVGAQLSTQLHQPVIVDNKAGAAGMIAADAVARAPGDGYTMFSADNGILIYNPVLYKKINYNPEKDFVPIALLARVPLVLVAAPNAGFNSVGAAVAALKAQPGKFSYASPGVGSPHHLAMELFKQSTGLFATHIPYRGAAPAMQDVMSGQVALMVVDTSTALTFIKSGRLVPIMTFSPKRIAQLPDIPTAKEAGYNDIEAYAWQGVVVPASTPAPIRERLTKELEVAIANPAVRKNLMEAGWEPNPTNAQLMAAYIAAEKDKWHALIRARGITAQ